MKIIITGGCGFLGSNLAEEVIKCGEELIIIDNLSRETSIKNYLWLKKQGEFLFKNIDIRDRNNIELIIADIKPDVIFHLAGQVAMTTSVKNPVYDFEINSLGTLNILEAIRKFASQCIVIYSSTNKVYGDLNWIKYNESETRYISDEYPNGYDENIPFNPQSPYGCSKGMADLYMLDYSRVFDIRTVVFRHSSMYGERQYATYDQGWIDWFCKQAIDTKNGHLKTPFTISGNGKQVRDILHSKDMKSLYFAAIKHIDKAKGQVFNIGGGYQNSISLIELFEYLNKELEIELKYLKLPKRHSDQRIFIADINKANSLLDWKPLINYEAGLSSMLKWNNHK